MLLSGPAPMMMRPKWRRTPSCSRMRWKRLAILQAPVNWAMAAAPDNRQRQDWGSAGANGSRASMKKDRGWRRLEMVPS